MPETEHYWFPPFRVDVQNGTLWREPLLVSLRPKTFAVLSYLLKQAGHIVSRDTLLHAVWGKTKVSPQVLRSSLWELRHALEDNVGQPHFIETVPGRGWRFIGQVVSSQHSVASSKEEARDWRLETGPASPQTSSLQPQVSSIVGRDSELTKLHGCLDKALSGERQLVFVTGEPGIGKTALIEEFLFGVRSREAFGVAEIEESQRAKVKGQKSKVEDLSPAPNTQPLAPVLIGRGQCIEHYGPGEAYMPMLEVLERLASAPDQGQLLAALRRYALLWLVQMPSLLEPYEYADLQRQLAGTPRERMLREMALVLEMLTRDAALVLVLEDLHWADASTIELLSYVARRPERARLLILGTYRPTETLTQAHPLRDTTRELLGHGYGTELALPMLGEEGVTTYLASRFPDGVLPVRLSKVLHRRSGGNPLFLRAIIEELLAQGLLTDGEARWRLACSLEELPLSIPDTLQRLLTKQSSALSSAEQRVLQVGSVVGVEFSVATVAAALEEDLLTVEEQCEGLVRRQVFLRRAGLEEWPDGTVAARYGFQHALYQQLWDEQVTVSHRQQWHQRIGLRKEVAYNGRAHEIATELAMHFEQGRDYLRAVRYLRQAGERAIQRSANVEAISHFTKGLEALKTLSDTPERVQQELSLQISLGTAFLAFKGFGSAEAEHAYTRARALCQQVGETPQLASVLWGLVSFFGFGGQRDFQAARELGEQLLRLALHTQDPDALILAYRVRGVRLYWQGELPLALDSLEQANALHADQQCRTTVVLTTHDSGVHCRCYAAGVLWALGYPNRALERIHEALALARELSHPHSLAYALNWAAVIAHFRGDVQAALTHSEALITLCEAQALRYPHTEGIMTRGWALIEHGQAAEGMAQLRGGLARKRAVGAGTEEGYWLLVLAEAHERTEQTEEGLSVITEALAWVDQYGCYVFEAELYRLKGELTLQRESQKAKVKSQKSKVTDPRPPNPDPHSQAEACFLIAIDIARKQHAKSLELRATLSLARLWQRQGKAREAHSMLSAVYEWFTEGFDTKDLQEAKRLIEELHH